MAYFACALIWPWGYCNENYSMFVLSQHRTSPVQLFAFYPIVLPGGSSAIGSYLVLA